MKTRLKTERVVRPMKTLKKDLTVASKTAHAPNPLLNPAAQAIEADATATMTAKRTETGSETRSINRHLTNIALRTAPTASEAASETEEIVTVTVIEVTSTAIVDVMNP